MFKQFQSTLPVWGETVWPAAFKVCWRNFNPLSPCGERLLVHCQEAGGASISIHSPRVGRDLHTAHYYINNALFQSTLPVWGETKPYIITGGKNYDFNPLSPCGERRNGIVIPSLITYFNPLSPCGERQQREGFIQGLSADFNPLSPCGERPLKPYENKPFEIISIHSPRVGRDF